MENTANTNISTGSSNKNTGTTVKIYRRKWEEVYGVNDLTIKFNEQECNVIYYQTYGGGPEGGYFCKIKHDPEDLNGFYCEGVWKVHRKFMSNFQMEKITNGFIEYQEADENKGIPAKCRVIIRKEILEATLE